MPVVAVDPAGTVLLANPAAQEAFPKTFRGAVGSGLAPRLPAGMADALGRFLAGQDGESRLGAELEGHALTIRLRKLTDGATILGCILVLEKA